MVFGVHAFGLYWKAKNWRGNLCMTRGTIGGSLWGDLFSFLSKLYSSCFSGLRKVKILFGLLFASTFVLLQSQSYSFLYLFVVFFLRSSKGQILHLCFFMQTCKSMAGVMTRAHKCNACKRLAPFKPPLSLSLCIMHSETDATWLTNDLATQFSPTSSHCHAMLKK